MNFSQQAVQALSELRTVQDMLRWSASRLAQADVFFGHGTENPWDEAAWLVAHALHLPWALLPEWHGAALTQSEREQIIELMRLRIEERVPAPYLIGEAWFCGKPYVVDERVLIPRSPIAEMIQQRFVPWRQSTQAPQRILDLCTGSGCIGIACAHEFEHAQVELLDISFDALAVAEENIEQHRVEDRVLALQSDLLSAASGRYDIIVSNPPYVDADDMACLPAEYLHEPELALAAGDDGLDLVHRLLRDARDFLTDDGLLVVEVGNSWPALAARYPQLPFVWPEFAQGGHGVFVLQARDLELL